MLPFAFEHGFGFERYVDYALDVPMYFVIRDGKYVNVAGESFRAFLEGKLPQLPGEKPTVKDWENHLSTLFPEVRLKQFLEMRGADMGDRGHVTALAGLLDRPALRRHRARRRLGPGQATGPTPSAQTLRNEVPSTAIHTRCPATPAFGTVADLARRGRRHLPSAGLVRRGVSNAEGEDETIYLAPLEETLRLDKTPAERWLDLYRGEWNGDLTRIFDAAEI